MRAGSFLATAALVAMAFCHAYYQFFLAHFLFGFGSGLIWPTVTAIGGHWFSTKRGTAIGVIVGGSGLGSIIYPIMLKHLLQRMCKWQQRCQRKTRPLTRLQPSATRSSSLRA